MFGSWSSPLRTNQRRGRPHAGLDTRGSDQHRYRAIDELAYVEHLKAIGAASRRCRGIGVIRATAIASTVIDPSVFKSGRDFAAWIGLVPRQHSTGGKERLGSISKQGDRYLRRLLVVGATAVVRHARQYPQKHPWVMKLLGKKPAKLVAVAVANKMARIAWAIMVKGGYYRAPELAAAA